MKKERIREGGIPVRPLLLVLSANTSLLVVVNRMDVLEDGRLRDEDRYLVIISLRFYLYSAVSVWDVFSFFAF